MNLVTETGFVIMDVTWYTDMPGNCIGIVEGQTAEGYKKAYIGVGDGFDEETDALLIARTGAPFHGVVA